MKKKTSYLTKRIIISASNKAIKEASIASMKKMGYVIKAEDGWIIKEYIDGVKEKMFQLEKNTKTYTKEDLD